MAVSTNKMTRLARFWQTKSQTIIPKKHQLTKQHRLGYKKIAQQKPSPIFPKKHPSFSLFRSFQKSQPIQPWPLRSLTLQAPPSCLSGAVRDDPEKPSFPSSEPGTVFSRPRLIHEKRSQKMDWIFYAIILARFLRISIGEPEVTQRQGVCVYISTHTHTLERPHVAVGFRTLPSNGKIPRKALCCRDPHGYTWVVFGLATLPWSEKMTYFFEKLKNVNSSLQNRYVDSAFRIHFRDL